jgi:tellurite resistance protein
VLVIMALTQVMLLPEYRKLPFTQMFWVFTFPVGATANYSIRWLATTDLPGREICAWTILGLATAFTLVIAARTVPTAIAPKSARLAAPQSTEVR